MGSPDGGAGADSSGLYDGGGVDERADGTVEDDASARDATRRPPMRGTCVGDLDCVGFDTCGGGGVDGACGCTPSTCPAGACEERSDGCGGLLDCGGCDGGEVCGGSGAPRVCAPPMTMTPVTACGELEGPGRYVLQNDVSSSGDCFTIDAQSGVVLEGAGHLVDSGGDAIVIRGHSSNIVVRDARARGSVHVEGRVVDAACSGAGGEHVLLERLQVEAGEILASDASCDLSIVDCTTAEQGIYIENPWFVLGGYLVLRNHTAGGISMFNAKDALIADNVIRGRSRLTEESAGEPSIHIAYRNNDLRSDEGYLDTLDILRIASVERSVFADNRIESLVTSSDAAVIMKLYVVRHTLFANNDVSTDTFAPDYGVVELRSSSQDNLFFHNRFVTTAGGAAYMSHFSNVGCDENGDYPPRELIDCRETGYDPTKYCGDTGHPNYRAPYDHGCHDRRNVFDSNWFEGGRVGVWHYGDGRDNIFVNNVIIGDTAVIAGFCESSDGGFIQYFHDTLVSRGGAAMEVGHQCAVQARSTIFHSTGENATSGDALTGAFNLFFPPAANGQDGAVDGDPRFVDATNDDTQARDYHLRGDSPAVDAADASGADAPMLVTVDRDGTARPTGDGFDIGAYER